MPRSSTKDAARTSRREQAIPHRRTGFGNKAVWFSVLIVACSLVAYSNSLLNDYAYDDHVTVVKNTDIQSFSTLISSLDPYRPVRWLTFAVDYRLWKLDPFGYHLSNLILHAVCGLLLFGVARLVIKDIVGALFVSLLFCAHPVTTEAVANISNRNELLGGIFSLSAFYCYIRKHDSRRCLVALLPLHVIALMSKEAIAVSLPLLYIGYDFYFNRDKDGRISFRRIVPGFAMLALTLVAVTTAVVLARLPVARQAREVFLFLTENTVSDAGPLLLNLNIWVRAMSKGLLLLSYPAGLSADYPVPRIRSLVDAQFLGSLAVLAITVLAVVILAKRLRTASFGLLWMLVFLLPVSNVVPITKHFMADRYLYAPAIGYCLFVGAVMHVVYRGGLTVWGYRAQKKTVLLLLSAILVLFIRADIRRNRDWQSDYTIWPRTAGQQPESPLARVNVSAILLAQGKYTQAIEECKKAIRIYDGYDVSFTGSEPATRAPSIMSRDLYASAYNNMGSAYMKLRKYEEAISAFKTALAASPYLYEARCNLGVSYLNEGQVDEAIDALKLAVRIRDRYPEAHEALSYAYQKKGMLEEARKESEKATALREAAKRE
jgi:hypothetical protein